MGPVGNGGGRSFQQSHRVRRVPRSPQTRRRNAAVMPELPEVETVRRGLAPIMEGASVKKVEVRDRRLRWPIAKDFDKRLTGKTIDGLGRRAKYLLADLSSGDVLIMHLGMSGSFRVALASGETVAGNYCHDRSKD